MSTLAYAALTTRRKEASPGTSSNAAAVDADNPKAGKPGVGTWVDTAAALVPAEVLAVTAFLIQTGHRESEGPGRTLDRHNLEHPQCSALVLGSACFVRRDLRRRTLD
jgi:hypothetical protein